MHCINVTNVNQALSEGLRWLLAEGVEEQSRNGTVLVSPCPVVTTYFKPTERVLFSPMRDANPFFHLMESLWMLAGRNDVAFPSYFLKRFAEYSDDGVTANGAYGYRWREWFGYDQLKIIAKELRKNPESRRCVLSMWDGQEHAWADHGQIGDLLQAIDGGKDVPCNTHIYFDCRDRKLNMTVCNRSNDIIWGAYGANAVHMSILQEFMAFWVGVPVGHYRQFSNNFHAYTDVYPKEKFLELAGNAFTSDRYEFGMEHFPLVQITAEAFLEDLKVFLEQPAVMGLYAEPFFDAVAVPMYRAYKNRKDKINDGFKDTWDIQATDWQRVCQQWILRREAAKKAGA